MGDQTTAKSYGPDPVLIGVWALLLSLPAIIIGFDFIKSPSRDEAVQFMEALVVPLLPILFAVRFRVTFAPTEFIYRRWGPTIRVPYDQMRSIEVTNRTPLSNDAVGAFIVARNGVRFPFWPKLFPRKAIDRFFALAPRSVPQKLRH